MKSEWHKCVLGDIVTFSSGGTPNKSIAEYWNGNIPWISAKTMKNERISSSDLYITEEGLQHGSKLAKKGSILFLVRGSGLFNGIPVCLVEKPVAYNQDVKCIESCCEVENIYIFYWLLAQANILKGLVGTTTIGAGKFDMDQIKQLEFCYPDKESRESIVKFAEAISLKIKTNNRINDYLHQQAQSIFNAYYDASDEKKQFTSLIHVLGGGTPKTGIPDFWDGAIPFFTPKDTGTPYVFQTEKNITESGLQHCNSRLYPKNTTFVTARGTVGKVSLAGKPMAMNQSCYALVSDVLDPILVYFYSLRAVDSLKHKAAGSVFDAIVTRDFETEAISVIKDDDSEKVLKAIKPMMNMIHSNTEEIRRLVALRDTLLPRLMSGEVDVSAIAV